MKRFGATLFSFVFAVAFFRGGVADDPNFPITVNNKSGTLPPVTIVPESTTTESSTTPFINNGTNITTVAPTTTTKSTTPPSNTTSTSTTSTTPSPPPPSPSPTTTSSTTVKPETTTASVPTTPVPHKNHFDGPSFIGGIILATGLMGIGFVAFKFYKARTERNYHTL